MNADYYNAEPGFRSIDEMFWECADIRDELAHGDESAEMDELTADPEPETSDDIDDAYDLEEEQEYEEDFD